MSRKSSQGQLNHRSGSQTTSQYTTLNRRSTALPSSPILSAEQQSDFHLTTTLHIRESSLQPGWYLATTTFTLLSNGSKGPKSYLDKIPTEGLRLGLIVVAWATPSSKEARWFRGTRVTWRVMKNQLIPTPPSLSPLSHGVGGGRCRNQSNLHHSPDYPRSSYKGKFTLARLVLSHHHLYTAN